MVDAPEEHNQAFQPVNNWGTFAEDFVARHKVGDASSIWDLHLDVSMYVDRDLKDCEDKEIIARRTFVRDAALDIKRRVAELKGAIQGVEKALDAFERSMGVHHWSAVLLGEVFDAPFPASSEVMSPEYLDEIRGFFLFNPIVWDEVNRKIELVSDLKVRSKLRGNKVGNHALEQSLLACRTFWIAHVGKASWKRQSLTAPGAIEATTKVSELTGRCERFVGDMLTSACLDLTAAELRDAWTLMERHLARNEPPGTRRTRPGRKKRTVETAVSTPPNSGPDPSEK
jgi:hypothetical protein